jgi:hypothetical protein
VWAVEISLLSQLILPLLPLSGKSKWQKKKSQFHFTFGGLLYQLCFIWTEENRKFNYNGTQHFTVMIFLFMYNPGSFFKFHFFRGRNESTKVKVGVWGAAQLGNLIMYSSYEIKIQI